jgi:hypothetical protein
MPTYTVTGYQWAGFTTYPTSFSIEINDDDPDLDWFGGDTGTAQTATFGGTTYNIDGAGLLPTNIGGGATSSEELLFMSLGGYGWVFFALPGSVFTPGDALTGWTTGTWSDTDGVAYTDAVCFTSGTQIETDEGSVKIEELSAGDLVKTVDNGYLPVQWISSTKIGIADQVNDPSIRPILIRKGALGPNTPCRDTRVSPQHRVLYSGWKAELFFGELEVLIPAKALVQIGLAEIDISLKPVTYIHVLLEHHEVLIGDGLESESLMPHGQARNWLSADQCRELNKLVPLHVNSDGNVAKLTRPEFRTQEAIALA